MQALQQATFALPQPLVTALVNCSVQLPRPLTHLAAAFDQYGLVVAKRLPDLSQNEQMAHPGGHQSLLENACRGLELHHALPHFADAVNRYA